jgi:tetratricopeptide (TPR) repeat protein
VVKRRPVLWSRLIVAILACLIVTSLCAAQQTQRAIIQRLIRSNHLDQAEQQIWITLHAHPNEGWAFDLLGSIRLQQKRNGEAQALFQHAYELNQRDISALRGLGDAARDTGTVSDAIGWYAKLLLIAPADVAARKSLSILQEQSGSYKESVTTINGIPLALRTPDLLPVLASDYISLHQDEKVGALIAQLLRMGNAQPKVKLDFAAILIRNGYLKDADKLLQVSRPAHPTAEYLHILARVREAQQRIPEASDLLQQALQLEPESYDLLFDCARFAAQHERWTQAVEMLSRANAVSPDRPEVLMKLTLALLKSRHREKAVVVARQLNAVSPNDPDAEYILASALVDNELWEVAEPIALQAVQARPNDANNQLLMGIIHLSKGEMEAARQRLDRALTLDPNLQDAHYYSALVSERTGAFDSARKELDALVKNAPNHAGGQAELGVLDLRLGNLEGARSALEAAVKLAPETSQSHYQLGLVYARLGLQNESKTQMAEFQRLREAEDAFRKREAGVRVPQNQ